MKLGCTVQELLGRISSRELTEWLAYDLLEPFSAQAEYLGSAIVASTVANVNRPHGKKALTVKDFMPEFGQQQKEQDPESMIQIASMMTLGLGGQDLREVSDG